MALIQVYLGCGCILVNGLINIGYPHRYDGDELASFSKRVVVRTQSADSILKVALASPENNQEPHEIENPSPLPGPVVCAASQLSSTFLVFNAAVVALTIKFIIFMI